MLERRKPKENIGAIKKTWLREKPWMSRGFYTWVTSEFHTWVTSVSGMWKVWFPQWEGSSRVAGGHSPAAGVAAGAESPLLTLGVLRDTSLSSPVAPQGRQWGWEVPFSKQKYQTSSTLEGGQRVRGERLVHEKIETGQFSSCFCSCRIV